MPEVARRYPAREIKLLWALAAGRCSFPSCRALCIGPPSSEGDPHAIVGDIAHIYPHSRSGPRGDEKAPDGLNLDSYANWILLCASHHREVDQQPLRYRADFLVAAKQSHEGWVWRSLSGGGPSKISTRLAPFVELRSSVRLFKIFRTGQDPLMAPGGLRLGRFDDPFGEFGVLYSASSAEAALAQALAPLKPSPGFDDDVLESIRREWAERNFMALGRVPRGWYTERSVAEIEVEAVCVFRMSIESSRQLTSLTGQVGEDAGTSSDGYEYRISQSMARQLHDLRGSDGEAAIDGITWPSTTLSGETLFALFDRALERARIVSTQPLESPWTRRPD